MSPAHEMQVGVRMLAMLMDVEMIASGEALVDGVHPQPDQHQRDKQLKRPLNLRGNFDAQHHQNAARGEYRQQVAEAPEGADPCASLCRGFQADPIAHERADRDDVIGIGRVY